MSTSKKVKAKKEAPHKRSKVFNLNIKTPEQAVVLVAELTSLKFSGGWKLLTQILEGNMAQLERSIITKLDAWNGTKLSEVHLDELRAKHAVFAELLAKPDDLIELFQKKSGGFVPIYDPYHSDINKMLRGETREEVAETSAGTLT